MRPHLVRWTREYGPKGLVVIEVDDGRIDSLAEVKAHVDRDRPPYFVVHDGQGTITGRFGIRAYPTAYLVDRNGKVVWAGFPTQNLDAVEQAIQDALGAG